MPPKVEREWFPPAGFAEGSTDGHLVLYNSLIDEKVKFVPASHKTSPNSKQITWYTCGPTVYDSAHLGHARNYVAFDIVRRVLEDYFGYNCLFVMNVTDVDDKIILRARRNFLLEEYKSSTNDAAQVLHVAGEAVSASVAKQTREQTELAELVQAAQAKGDSRKVDELQTKLEQEASKLKRSQDVLSQLEKCEAGVTVEAVLKLAGDFIAERLDKQKGADVREQSIYRAHAAKYEAEFFKDLEALGCRPPDVITRVTEYIEEIIDYIKQIIENEMGYESNGSVYFDTQKFRACGHTYAKLKPWAVGSAALASESEANFETKEKHHPNDFALWKTSKAGEPFWESPWGSGRPGWHIECSAMASEILGKEVDIHTGGEDLRFPHHDNELAQAEAYFHNEDCKQWVNYFLHAGHLNIDGLKMSKSLKNFIRIGAYLKTGGTARQLRLMFALQPWWKPMMYSESSVEEMRTKESLLKNMFQNAEAAIREADIKQGPAKWGTEDFKLSDQILEVQQEVHNALLDSIDTQKAMDALLALAKKINLYLSKETPPQPFLLRKAIAYINKILTVFGLSDGSSGFGSGGDKGGDEGKHLQKVLEAFSTFRDEVRGLVKAKAEGGELMKACDRLRDETMVELGVRLEDRPDGRAVVKLDDPEVLRAEVAARQAAVIAAARKKLETLLTKKVAEKDKFEKLAALPSVETALKDKFSKFDETTGDPTHDVQGNPLEGKALDKARKDKEKLLKVREPLRKKLEEDPNFLSKLGEEIEELQAKLGPSNGVAH